MAENGSQTGTVVSGVAGRYASALFDLARDAGAMDAVGADLDRFEGLIEGNPDLARLVRSPIFTAEEQTRAIAAILDKAGIGGLAGNFIRLVASKRRLFALPRMIVAYRELLADAKGIVRAEVRLAEQPSEAVTNEIRAALKEVAGAEIDMRVRIDPALIGGLVVQIGSRMVDASLRTKLNSIRLAMQGAR
ncbi:F0F1 ATP synthase subunit delta [Salinarimonas soli]|uniref:ATP synthase subunit delta n=1 Tax=Salinarimonas soli TaxID=1638099 RepID=A0A5B2VF84_9HYPH|nr:F0F1 ATP synthase subunit delta [Salinarimonas soli]KAA2236857.1 F0F1 ATP synthase subunit delta [Salinarimonas soli]